MNKGTLDFSAANAIQRGVAEQIIRITGNVMPDVDYELAALYLECAKGCVAVEMAPVPTITGNLFIGSGTEGEWRNRPDFGTVISVSAEIPLVPGDVVVINHEHGKRIEGAIFGDYEAEEEVRIFGRAAQSGGIDITVPWFESIIGELENLQGNVIIRPTHDWVIVERDAVYERSEGGVWLPDNVTHRSTKGTVLAAGPATEVIYGVSLKRGDRVCYMANTIKRFSCPGIDSRNMMAIRASAILGVVYGENLSQHELDRLPMNENQPASIIELNAEGEFSLELIA